MSLVQHRSGFKRAQLAGPHVCLGAGGWAGFHEAKKTPFCLRAPINKSVSASGAGEENGLSRVQLSVKQLPDRPAAVLPGSPGFGRAEEAVDAASSPAAAGVSEAHTGPSYFSLQVQSCV